MKMLRVWLQPFEIAFVLIIVIQGVISLIGDALIDPTNALLPSWMAKSFQGGYIFAGVVILIGILLPRGDVEGAGLILLGLDLLARAVMFGQYLGWGWQSVTSLAFSVLLALACLARLILLIKSLTLVIVHKSDIIVRRKDGNDGVQ